MGKKDIRRKLCGEDYSMVKYPDDLYKLIGSSKELAIKQSL